MPTVPKDQKNELHTPRGMSINSPSMMCMHIHMYILNHIDLCSC